MANSFRVPYPRLSTELHRVDGSLRPAGEQIDRNFAELTRMVGTASAATRNAARMVCLTATGDSIASGGDYITFGSVAYEHEFGSVSPGTSITWPASAVGIITVSFEWTSYTGGGTIEIEVDGTVPAWGVLATGTSGSSGCKSRAAHIRSGSSVRIKVTQGSGSAQVANVFLDLSVPDPTTELSRYAAVVLADGPLAYWRLGEASGGTAVDQVGGHDATYTGSPSKGAAGVMLDGSGDTAVDFSGSGQYATGADWADIEFAGTAPFTIEAWVNPDGKAALQGVITKTYSHGASDNDGWSMYVTGSDVGVARSNRTTSQGVQVAMAPAGKSIHVVGTYDGTDLLLYINGALAGSSSTAISIPANTGQFVIANGNLGAGPETDPTGKKFDGRIDEVAIYDRPLTPSEVAEHYEVGTLAA